MFNLLISSLDFTIMSHIILKYVFYDILEKLLILC